MLSSFQLNLSCSSRTWILYNVSTDIIYMPHLIIHYSGMFFQECGFSQQHSSESTIVEMFINITTAIWYFFCILSTDRLVLKYEGNQNPTWLKTRSDPVSLHTSSPILVMLIIVPQLQCSFITKHFYRKT